MLRAVARGRFPPIAETGNRRSMISVSDLIAAARLVMQQDQAAGRRYLVADGVDYSTRCIFEAMSEALDRPLPHWSVPASALRLAGQLGDRLQRLTDHRSPVNSALIGRLIGSACYRADRLRGELHWAPDQDLRCALPDMVRRCRELGQL